MTRLLALCILCALASCTVTPPPKTPTAVTITATFSTATPIPTITLTVSPSPVITVEPTPAPGGFRLRTVRAIPVGVADVTAAICHDANYWWQVYPSGMSLHEDPIGERECLGLKTL